MIAGFSEMVEQILNETLKPENTVFEKALLLYRYFDNHYVYDWDTYYANEEGKAYLSSYRMLTEKMGICQDLSAVTIAMLRSLGVPARLMIGTLGSGTYHAWVTAIVNGEEKFFDPTVEVGAGSKNETYTTERYY
jgi:transglutaminase-like putative cysteine protease